MKLSIVIPAYNEERRLTPMLDGYLAHFSDRYGEDAEIIEGSSGNVISRGLGTIPTKSQLIKIASRNHFKPIAANRAEMESRIAYCYEVDGSCPCDEDICIL